MMEWIFENLNTILGLISALALVLIYVTALTKSTKDDEWAKEIINKLERLIQKDIDKDGDIGQ